jgi:preprotein translocase subunit SecG
MTGTLLVVQFVLTVLLTILVLLQKSSSIGLGAYSGSNESVFGAKGAGGFLTKATFTVAIVFVINTIALGYAYNQAANSSVAEDIQTEQIVPSVPTAPANENTTDAPSAPVEQ